MRTSVREKASDDYNNSDVTIHRTSLPCLLSPTPSAQRRASNGAARNKGYGDASDAAATRVTNLCLAFGRQIRNLLPGTHGDDDDVDGV